MEKFEFNISIPISRKTKFGVKWLLTLVLLVAVGFAAFRFGNNRGRENGYAAGYEDGWSESMASKLTKKSYRISDYSEMSPQSFGDLMKLAEEIRQEVETTSWEHNGGPAKIDGYPQDLSLTITQTQRGHRAVEKFLKSRRLQSEFVAP
jgi:hypothetical protein